MKRKHKSEKSTRSARPIKAKDQKHRRKSRGRKDPTEGLEVTNPNAAAIDIGCSEHWVAVPPGRSELSVKRYGCCTEDLNQLAQWLKDCGVETVVMEATGNYWVVLYDILEENNLRPVVVNPRYAKNMSGKKGDIPDCQWMQKLHMFGLFSNSFRPVECFRVLRTLTRQRENLVAAAAQTVQHMQRSLTEMNVQLANVISDISGDTGLRIIDAILKGERDPEALASLRDPRIRTPHRKLVRALEGHWKEEQIFLLEQARDSYSHFQGLLEKCAERIEQQMKQLPTVPEQQPVASSGQAEGKKPQKPKFDLGNELRRILGVDLTKIPSIGPVTAQVFLSEVGNDVSAWRTEKHFSSWLGLCPDHRITGGRIFSRSTRPVVTRLRNALRIAAYTLDHSQSALGAKYRRLKHKLGAPKAITAMANCLAKLIYRMIKFGHEYTDKGMKAYEAKFQAQRRRWLEKQAKAMNLKVVEA